jgi:hypothetical protein
MRDLVVACAIGKVSGEMALDLNNIEDQKGEADIPIAMMPRSRQITLLQMDGRLTGEEINRAYELFLKGAEIINTHQREALRTEFGNADFGVTDESSPDVNPDREAPPVPPANPDESEPIENCVCDEDADDTIKESEQDEL